jgi:hypothetical protein
MGIIKTEPARLAWDDGTGAMTVLPVTSGEQTTLELRRHLIGRAANRVNAGWVSACLIDFFVPTA